MDVDDVRVLHRGRGARFHQDLLDQARVGTELGMQRLQRDGAGEDGVPRLVQHPHTAAPEFPANLEFTVKAANFH